MVATGTSWHPADEETVVDAGENEYQEVDSSDEVQEAVPEKLQDDDQLAEIWYKRLFFTILPQLRRGMLIASSPSPFILCCQARTFIVEKLGMEMGTNLVCRCVLNSRSSMHVIVSLCLVEDRRRLRANNFEYNRQFRYVVSRLL